MRHLFLTLNYYVSYKTVLGLLFKKIKLIKESHLSLKDSFFFFFLHFYSKISVFITSFEVSISV